MLSRADRFFREIKGKNIALLGIGVSHISLIKLLHEKGALITACDRRSRKDLGDVCDELDALGVKLALGDDYLDNLCADIIFRTPGMRFFSPQLNAAREAGMVVTSEMELFFDLCPCKIFAVTGSDGKTTTTTLISEFLKAQGKTVHLGGNIGRALLPEIEDITARHCAVVELSSFQLISMRSSPHIAVVTNISPNHLDEHKDMDEYVQAKTNILRHQNAFSRTVLNLDNAPCAQLGGLVRGKLCHFSRKGPVKTGAYLNSDGNLYYREGNIDTLVISSSDIHVPGSHNIENFLAAISAVWGFASVDAIRKTARKFGGVEHRIEFVRELDGVKWYNDSIATTPTRAIAALKAFDKRILLIAGGYDKKIPFEPLAPVINERVKHLILLGATAGAIESAVKNCAAYDPAILTITRVADMDEAIGAARRFAVPGDIVSLSPACASFDMYRNFEARGKHFKLLVGAQRADRPN